MQKNIIDDKLLAKLGRLASIEINEQNAQKTKENLEEVLGFVERLNELDLENENAKFYPLDNAKTPMREDIPREQNDISELVLKAAPKAEDGFFIVPKIIE